MFSFFVFGSVLTLAVAQQCPVNPDSGSIQYPPLPTKNISIQETPPKGGGLDGWLVVPSSLIDAVWGTDGFPYAVFDQSQPNAVVQFPSGHIPVIATAVLGLFLAGVLVSCWCCVCCFWCCCCCFEDDEDRFKDNSDNFACKLFCFISVLIIVIMLMILILVGAVFGFVANVGMSNAIGSFPPTANEAATAVRDFLDGLNADVTTVIEGGFNTTVDCLQNRTIGLDGTFRTALAEHSNLTAILDSASTSVSNLTAELSAIETSLGTISTSVMAVNTLAMSISTGLEGLSMAAVGFTVPNGSEVLTAATNLATVTSVTAPLQAIMVTNDTLGNVQPQLGQLDAGLTEFSDGVETSLQAVMSGIVDTVRGDVTAAVEQFSSGIILVNHILGSLTNAASILQTEPLDPTQPLLTYNTAKDLWYWFAVIFCVMVLFSIILISLGLVVGGIPYSCLCVPKRKRVSNIGSRILMVSVGTSLLTGALLLPMAGFCFYAGATGQELCEPLTSDDRFADTLDNDDWRRSVLRVILESDLASIGISEVVSLLTQAASGISFADGLRACQENQSLWSAFQLEQFLAQYAALDLPTDPSFSSFNLTSLLDMFSNAIDRDSTTVTTDTMSALAAVSSNITEFGGVSFPVVALKEIASYVNQSRAAVLTADEAFRSLQRVLEELETNFTSNLTLQELLTPILTNVSESLAQLGDINNTLNTVEEGRTSVEAQTTALNASLTQLPLEVTAVDGALVDNSSSLYQAVTSDVQSIINSTLGYPNHVLGSLSRDAGRCFPLWAGYNNVHNNICLDFVNNLNAYWYSLGWCVLWLVVAFIPLIILVVMFRKPLEKPLSMKDHAKNASRSIELLTVSDRENGWSWRQSSDDRNPVGVPQPGNRPTSFDNLPFETTASTPVSAQSSLPKPTPQDSAFERTTSYSKSTFSAQGPTGPSFERTTSYSKSTLSSTEPYASFERIRAESALKDRPLPSLPPAERDPKLAARPLPNLPPEQSDPKPTARPDETEERKSHPLANINAAAAAAEPQSKIPQEPEDYIEPSESEPHDQSSAAEAKDKTSECEAEEKAPLLKEKTSERITQSAMEKAGRDGGRSPIEDLYVNENVSDDIILITVPKSHGRVEEEDEDDDDYVIANPQQSQVESEEGSKTTLNSASSSQDDVEGVTISFDDVDSD